MKFSTFNLGAIVIMNGSTLAAAAAGANGSSHAVRSSHAERSMMTNQYLLDNNGHHHGHTPPSLRAERIDVTSVSYGPNSLRDTGKGAGGRDSSAIRGVSQIEEWAGVSDGLLDVEPFIQQPAEGKDASGGGQDTLRGSKAGSDDATPRASTDSSGIDLGHHNHHSYNIPKSTKQPGAEGNDVDGAAGLGQSEARDSTYLLSYDGQNGGGVDRIGEGWTDGHQTTERDSAEGKGNDGKMDKLLAEGLANPHELNKHTTFADSITRQTQTLEYSLTSQIPSIAPTVRTTAQIPSITPTVRPSQIPSITPTVRTTAQIPSITPTVRPSQIPSITPTVRTTAQIPSITPTVRPSQIPSITPTESPTAVLKFTSSGSFSLNAKACQLSSEEFIEFYTGVEVTLKETVCGSECDAAVEVKITNACGLTVEQLLGGSSSSLNRRLQSSDYDFLYSIIATVVCETSGCSGEQDIANADAIIGSIADSLTNAIQSGSFASTLSSNSNIASVLPSDVLGCLVAWGTMPEANIVPGLPASGTNTSKYYPDWTVHSGTCKHDGYEPNYMKREPGYYLYDDLEACCDEHYSGWNKPKCMNYKGSGMWFVDHILGKCRTDCEKDIGGSCGGIANTMSVDLFTNPKDCCEAELLWANSDWCEADSLEIKICYCGTGKYYRGNTVCVKDYASSCAGGDETCGGIVETSDVKLYDSTAACCADHFDWIENELCDARSNGLAVEKWWPDMSNSICVKDSETRAEDLSVSLYDTVEACCAIINWSSDASCKAKSTGEALQGSGKYFIDWVKNKCAEECVGPPPCGGVASGQVYDTADACCDEIPWVLRRDCVVV